MLRFLRPWIPSRTLPCRIRPSPISATSGTMKASTLPIVDYLPNMRVSDGSDGKANLNLTFLEEPLGLPAEDGCGWPQLEFYQNLGPNNRYVIFRKLGWGITSSTWLARDRLENSYVALKILNGYHTDLVVEGLVWEPEALKHISAPPSNPHCLQLASSFTFPGKGSAGEHLCMVTQLLGGDVKSLHTGKLHIRGFFPLPLAKRILLHILRGIYHTHSRGFIHTNIRHDNILYDTHLSTNDLDALLASDPPRRRFPEESHDGIVQAAVSQPLPMPSLEDALQRRFVLADFGSSRPIGSYPYKEFTPYAPYGLRPPEIVIGGSWNEKVDIWTFGCLVFEIAINHPLFEYNKYEMDEPSSLLYQMRCYTGEDYNEEQLTHGAMAANFTCNLKKHPIIYNLPFEKTIRGFKVLDETDIMPMATLMRRCLRLDPAQRASAAELLSDPWFAGVE